MEPPCPPRHNRQRATGKGPDRYDRTGRFDRPERFGRIVGPCISVRTESTNSVHAVLNVEVSNRPVEADINIRSNDQSNVQYCIYDQDVTSSAQWKDEIDYNVSLSYEENLHVTQSDFKYAQDTELYSIIHGYAINCYKVILYGYTYSDAPSEGPDGQAESISGIHDIHMNTSEVEDSKWPNREHDGAVGFLFKNRGHQRGYYIHWILLKFHTQHLPWSHEETK